MKWKQRNGRILFRWEVNLVWVVTLCLYQQHVLVLVLPLQLHCPWKRKNSVPGLGNVNWIANIIPASSSSSHHPNIHSVDTEGDRWTRIRETRRRRVRASSSGSHVDTEVGTNLIKDERPVPSFPVHDTSWWQLWWRSALRGHKTPNEETEMN